MGSPTISFGKFKGRTLESLLNTEEGISYVRWLVYKALEPHWRRLAKEALRTAGL